MGSSFNPIMVEEPNTSNCAVFIDELVSLLNCGIERMGVKVCVILECLIRAISKSDVPSYKFF